MLRPAHTSQAQSLLSEYGTHKTVKARLWPWIEHAMLRPAHTSQISDSAFQKGFLSTKFTIILVQGYLAHKKARSP